uniref:Adenylosuccinate synthase n=1 Tax=viral metagenome TaxID=1070528 RepID=A0A6C0CNJ2_9ZZZZ
MIIADVVVGLQHGDEGKGKVVYNLLKTGEYDICLRYNGGPNAGHTIKDVNMEVVIHQVPCGVLFNKTSIIGSNCVVDLDKLEYELNYLEENGFPDVRTCLHISSNAHVIQNSHIQTDKTTNTIGTTQSGIGPCYADKAWRKGKRIRNYQEVLDAMKVQIIDPILFFYNISQEKDQYILCEGAQGYMLDIDHGDYPYCTSSSCVSGSICNSGLPSNTIRHVYGCCKIYDTYIGNKPFQPENCEELETIGKIGKEFGSTTGRKRQCNWMNMEEMKKAIFINGCTHIIVNKCDIFEIAHCYRIGEKEFSNLEELKVYFESQLETIKKGLMIQYSFSPVFI